MFVVLCSILFVLMALDSVYELFASLKMILTKNEVGIIVEQNDEVEA